MKLEEEEEEEEKEEEVWISKNKKSFRKQEERKVKMENIGGEKKEGGSDTNFGGKGLIYDKVEGVREQSWFGLVWSLCLLVYQPSWVI